jgi:hypothetical protein
MDCREFDRVWNSWLDARDDRAADRELEQGLQAAGEHARDCVACGRAHVGYEALHRALAAWSLGIRASACPPPGLAERVVTALPNVSAALPASSRRVLRPWSGLTLGFAAAAAAAVIALVIAPDRRRNEPGRPSAPAPSRRSDSHILEDSLAEAAAATWELARSASEPAARLGRGVLEAATRADDASEEGASVTLTSVLRGPIDLAPSSTLFQEFGEHVSAGVRPLSSTARRAFDFLRAPSLGPDGRRIGQPTSKGA